MHEFLQATILPRITTIISDHTAPIVAELKTFNSKVADLIVRQAVHQKTTADTIVEIKELVRKELAAERKRSDSAVNRLTYLAMQNSLHPQTRSQEKKAPEQEFHDLFEELPYNHDAGYKPNELELEEIYDESSRVEELDD